MDKLARTELLHRTLRFDGISILDLYQVEDFLLRGLKPRDIEVLASNPELVRFNALVSAEERLEERPTRALNFDWNIPQKYRELDIEQHVLAVFGERLITLEYGSAQTELAINRVALELQEIERRGLQNLIRTIVFVLDRFKETNQVYGVGRGSSCASYVLFLLGLHVVDSIKYDVPMEEFFH